MAEGDRIYIRQHDYYGGDVWAEIDDRTYQPDIAIRWDSWGEYGGAFIVLDHDEVGRLISALTRLWTTGTSSDPG